MGRGLLGDDGGRAWVSDHSSGQAAPHSDHFIHNHPLKSLTEFIHHLRDAFDPLQDDVFDRFSSGWRFTHPTLYICFNLFEPTPLTLLKSSMFAQGDRGDLNLFQCPYGCMHFLPPGRRPG